MKSATLFVVAFLGSAAVIFLAITPDGYGVHPKRTLAIKIDGPG